MISDKQLTANRKNAQSSTGPRTPEGKENARFNALTHGMRTMAIDVLPDEDKSLFQARLAAWERDYQPATEAEARLVRRAAILSWKLDRAERHENKTLTERMNQFIEDRIHAGDEMPAAIEAAALAAFDPSNDGERLRRYEFSLERSLLRVVDTLLKLRRERAKGAGEISGANEPIPTVTDEPILQDARQECHDQIGANEPIPLDFPAPNEPILEASVSSCGGVEGVPGIKPARSPRPIVSNEPISPRRAKALSRIGARELDRFLAEEGRRDARGDLVHKISLGRR